ETPTDGAMPLAKLAQTTHAHLLAFAILYGATGLAFCFTSYPQSVRLVFGPLALVAQVLDIACWWLARVHPGFAQAIFFTGLVAGLGLAVQILGCWWDLCSAAGKKWLLGILVVLIVAGILGTIFWLVMSW